jgi:hypothetical protein
MTMQVVVTLITKEAPTKNKLKILYFRRGKVCAIITTLAQLLSKRYGGGIKIIGYSLNYWFIFNAFYKKSWHLELLLTFFSFTILPMCGRFSCARVSNLNKIL